MMKCEKYVTIGVLITWAFMAVAFWQEHQAVRSAWAVNDALVKAHDEERKAWATLYLTVTAYTASRDECDDDPDHTATMETPIVGRTCAVSRDLLYLLGKKVYIEGVGMREVTDLMSPRFERRVDLLVGNKKEARKLGAVEKRVAVITN